MTIAAAILLPLALQMSPALTGQGPERFQTCLAAIDADAAAAYETAMSWAAEGQSLYAYRCAAMALIAQNRFEEGARRLDSLGTSAVGQPPALQAELFSQAGNAWLLGREPARARSSFTRAVTALRGDTTIMPDVLIDRARAYAMEADYRHAEEDLSNALDMRPNDALALRLRASARMHQNSFDLAEADATSALTLAASEDDRVNAALVLGHVRESKRTGQPVEEQ